MLTYVRGQNRFKSTELSPDRMQSASPNYIPKGRRTRRGILLTEKKMKTESSNYKIHD